MAETTGRRFGPIRESPPPAVLDRLGCSETVWRRSRFGEDDEGFPNGGIWRFTPVGGCGHEVMVKRTGPGHLGGQHVWSLTRDPDHPQWWGREAAFYTSESARTGWPAGCRVPRCWVDDHDGVRDLWMEAVDGVPASLELCDRAVRGLAHWQVATADRLPAWAAVNWIGEHVGRYQLDNDRTLAHPGWPALLERGLDPAARELVADRPTDPAEVRVRLAELPQLPTHHDFHNGNIGTDGTDVVIFDWAYLGAGPVGHDVGHLALTFDPPGAVDPVAAWHRLTDGYCRALAEAGWRGDPAVVRRSMALSNKIRFGRMIDQLLQAGDQLDEAALSMTSRTVALLIGAE